MNALARFFMGRQDRDGAVPALETLATNVPLAILEPTTRDPVAEAPETFDRRQRALSSPRTVLHDAMVQKVLHGWLQNRHQTLLPLTLNFRVLDAPTARLLVGVMAAALLATSVEGADEREAALSFLRTSGADEDALTAFRRSLDAPEPLAALFEQVRRAHGIGPLAYVMIVVVNDSHEPANQIFAQWAAAKLQLPATVVRSVERRYRH